MEAGEAALLCGDMWVKLGRLFARRAYELAKSNSCFDRDKAIDFAKAAEGCFWHATGDEDCFGLGDKQ